MKIVSFLAVLLGTSAASFAADTAYQALRAIGNERGQEVLNRVIEVDGRNGAPQPGSWKIVLDDQTARGGIRELEVKNGKIVSERTPVNPSAGASAVMNFQKLNLDSAGAFTIAEKEATKAHLGFDSVDYALRSGAEGKSPQWVLQLLDAGRRTVGTMNIAADSGVIVRSDLYGRQRDAVVDVPDGGPRVTREPDDRMPPDDDEYVDDGNGGRLRVGHRINKALHQAGATLEEFFTGKRTIDRKYRDE